MEYEPKLAGEDRPVERPDPLEAEPLSHSIPLCIQDQLEAEPLSHPALLYIRDRLEETADGYDWAGQEAAKAAEAALKDFMEACWSNAFKGTKPIKELNPATLYVIRDVIRADVAYCKDTGFEISADFAKMYLDEFMAVDWSRYIPGVDLSKDKPEPQEKKSEEKKPYYQEGLNPECCICYARDESGQIVDIVEGGDPNEAVGMAIHYLAKQIRSGSGDLLLYSTMLATAATMKEKAEK